MTIFFDEFTIIFYRLTHWNKINQEQKTKNDRKPKRKRNFSGNFNNKSFTTETMILPKSKTYGYFRNAAHPRKAKFITNIQGVLLPTIFDEDRGRKHSPNPPPASTVGLSLPDILAFDQTRHSQVQNERRTALDRMHKKSSPLPSMFKSLQIGRKHSCTRF